MKKNRIAWIAPAFALAFALGAPQAADASPEMNRTPPTGPGNVLETMDAGGYTYLKIAFADREAWIAGPVTGVAVGDETVIPAGLLMEDFRSETLGRSFDQIWFVTEIGGGADPHAGHDHGDAPHGSTPAPSAGMGQGMGGGMGSGMGAMSGSPHPTPGASAEAAGFDLSGIEKLADGHTVGEIFTDRADLVGKEIAFRGRVVKFLPQIMGTNWLHVRDGSGADGSNDITITTKETVAPGDMVQVRGVLQADRDFGMGYRYDLILEDAAVTVE